MDLGRDRLGLSPQNISRFTTADLELNFANLAGNAYPKDLPWERITQRLWASMATQRSWDPEFDLLQQMPTGLELPEIPVTPLMVTAQNHYYAADPAMDYYLVSPRKLHSLGLDENVEITYQQLFYLKNKSTDDGKYLSPANLLTPPQVDVARLLENWDLTNIQRTFNFNVAVLKYYEEVLTLPDPLEQFYSTIPDELDSWNP